MKKLSLVLGSLLIAATASAKEVVKAPVVVVEPVVECATCEIPVFQPTGYISLEAEYRGNSERGGWDKDTNGNRSYKTYGRDGARAGRNKEHVFYELLGGVDITPKDTFSFRGRAYDSVTRQEDSVGESNDLRLRWDHKFGYIFDKVSYTTRVEARLENNHDAYTLYNKFEFKDYFSNNGFYKTNSFAIVPKVRYTDFDNEPTQVNSTGVGADFNHLGAMDLGMFGTLETELNVLYIYSDTNSKTQGMQNPYGGSRGSAKSDRGTSNGNSFAVEAYLYHTLPLWSTDSGRYAVQFYQEGGLDPMEFDHRSTDNGEATIYYEPKLQLVQHLNTATSLTYSAGAYYANNWSNGKGDTGRYDWEPRAGVKLSTKF